MQTLSTSRHGLRVRGIGQVVSLRGLQSRSKPAIAILLLAIFALTFAAAIPPAAHAENISAWNSTTSYTKTVSDESCAINSGTMYCVGGLLNGAGSGSSRVFYGPVTGSGVTSWTETLDYGGTGSTGGTGVPIRDQSCAAAKGYIYCVGGLNGTGALETQVFYGPVTGSGVTSWTETTDYGGTGHVGKTGVPAWALSCAIYSAVKSYIYCVGGTTTGGAALSQVWYAQVTSSGVGAWSETIDYGAASGSSGLGGLATPYTSCVTSSGYIYCAAGENSGTGNGYSQAYYAPVSGTGVGAWVETTDYGAASLSDNTGAAGTPVFGLSCAASGGYMYCIGGRTLSTYTNAVYYAQITSSGIGVWASAANYGASLANLSCRASGSDIYCVGGDNPTATASVLYGAIAAPVPVFPYGVLPFLLIIPALYYLVSRRHAGKAAPAPSMGGT